jgi:hypothetical protein
MAYNRQSACVSSTWGQLNASAVELLFAVTLLIGSASLVSMASGDPETMALVALTGITVVLLGMGLLRLSEYLRTTDLTSF